MENIYVATFFSHFDAVQFGQRAKSKGLTVKLMPVPRTISSSCGTGAQFTLATGDDFAALIAEGVDKIFLHDGQNYSLCYDADDV